MFHTFYNADVYTEVSNWLQIAEMEEKRQRSHLPLYHESEITIDNAYYGIK